MSMRQLWEGSDSAEWARRLNGRTKLLVLLAFAILTVVIDNPRTLFLLFTSTLVFHFAARTTIYKWEVMAILLLLGLWGSMFSQALFFSQTPRTPLLVLVEPGAGFWGRFTDGIVVYREGILYGAVQGLRSSIMLSLGLLVCWSSDPRQMLKALAAWKLSPQIAFMLVTAIRFLPVLASETGEIIIALRLRSARKNGQKSIIRYLPYIAKPLLARCLRRAQTLALSVVSRGVFLSTSSRKSEHWPVGEKVFCFFLIAFSVIVLLSKISYIFSEHGIYFGSLRTIYDWTKWYL
ncbi:MAG: energy-coupling factor transporter transmembrane component T family protein [Acidaminococcaceae bacterium]